MTPVVRPAWQQALILLSATVVTTTVFATLYIGRALFVPIAMAVFFTYVLAPVVSYFQRRGLPRTAAVIITVLLAVVSFVGASVLVSRELTGLSQTVADNGPAIRDKIANAKAGIVGSTDSPLRRVIEDVENVVSPKDPQAQSVVLEPRRSAWSGSLETIIAPATEAFAQAGFTFILLVFMLLSKTDLADRLLRLVGDGRMTVTTRAMAEASQRISRYLFRQLVVNVTFGLYITAALHFAGLKYALLWGAIIMVMRYVPYIGTWLGAIPPVLFAFAVGPDWTLTAFTAGIILGSEMLVNNFVEPRVYGHSLGVSEVAQLISAAFWSFLWGPVGLILSGPITTCLYVLGRHAPSFKFLEVLLGNEPPLAPGMALFQRLSAKDQDEALRTLRKAIPDHATPAALLDEVFVPALAQVKKAMLEGEHDADDERRIQAIAREVLDDTLDETRPVENKPAFEERVRVLACPAQDEFDRLVLDALTAQLPLGQWETRTAAGATLMSELLEEAAAYDPQVVLIGTLPPGGTAHARYLVKRLRQRLPAAHIVLGRWHDDEARKDEWTAVGADYLATTLPDAAAHLAEWRPVLKQSDEVRIVPAAA
jgi:predicted PurR-regulated permease PerM